jgi:hypothetical protein
MAYARWCMQRWLGRVAEWRLGQTQDDIERLSPRRTVCIHGFWHGVGGQREREVAAMCNSTWVVIGLAAGYGGWLRLVVQSASGYQAI